MTDSTEDLAAQKAARAELERARRERQLCPAQYSAWARAQDAYFAARTPLGTEIAKLRMDKARTALDQALERKRLAWTP